MIPAPDRRDFLRIWLGAAAGLSCAPMASAAAQSHASPPTPLAATALGDDMVWISGAGGNVVALRGPGGLVLANGGSAERSGDLLAVLEQHFPGAPVRTLFNTDWHPTHTGANERLAATGADILAHELAKQYLAADLFVDWEHRTYKARPTLALPTKTIAASGELTHGAERIEFGTLGQAHTDSDIYVYFRNADVLVAGDVLTVGRYPIADYTTGGWLGGLAAATRTLLDLATDRTRIVPGEGPLQTRADLRAQHDMLATMRDRVGKMMRQGMGAQDMLAAGITKEFDPTWGDPALFLSTSYRGMWLHVRELGGVV
jgi:glyoxylase-like metal-dependent hydrolase (beta-lactamase superfamily II)